jgi:hypothetical protein
MGQFSIQPIIRLVVVGIVLLSERILSEYAVVGSWAQLLAVRSTIPRRKLKKVPYCTLKKQPNVHEHHHKKSCAGETTKR